MTVLPDQYVISATPAAGMYGGWVGLVPSRDAMAKEASLRCPNGYKTVNEEDGKGPFATDYLRWGHSLRVSASATGSLAVNRQSRGIIQRKARQAPEKLAGLGDPNPMRPGSRPDRLTSRWRPVFAILYQAGEAAARGG